MSLFEKKDFEFSTGLELEWKIECDALTEKDYETLAWLVAEKRKVEFENVYGIPYSGIQFANALREYVDSSSKYALIVDDVLTTGKSFSDFKDYLRTSGVEEEFIGVVIFARTNPETLRDCPDWVRPIFQLEEFRMKGLKKND